MNDRGRGIDEAATRTFDLIVIGGGINGAGIARDAAQRGLRVLLLERHDWGFGTTWRSTKLIHGGLRYLEHGEVALVFESLRERSVLLRTAAHLVRPLPLLLPVYAGNEHGMLLLRAGLTAYDLLAWGGGLPCHRTLTSEQCLGVEPSLRRDGLRGGLAYWDAQVELPERLCYENVRDAQEHGAVALNHVEVERILRRGDRVIGVVARDHLSATEAEFHAPNVVNAAGPWVDHVLHENRQRRIGGTRGTHIVVQFPDGGPRRPLYSEAPDGRPFFILPWRGVHLIGTTDVAVHDPDDTLPSDAEIDYLFKATKTIVPDDALDWCHVWYAYAGIRPLPMTQGRREGAITRRHHIVDHSAEGFAGLLSVIGGKLSTYRSLAEQVTDRVVRRTAAPRKSRSQDTPLVPGDWQPDRADPEALRLWRSYGPRAADVFAIQRAAPETARQLCPHTLVTIAEGVYSVRSEGAWTVADVLLRRTPAGWAPCLGVDAALVVAEQLIGLGGSSLPVAAAVSAYLAEVERTFRAGSSFVASVR